MSLVSLLKNNKHLVSVYYGLRDFYYKNLISDEDHIRKMFRKQLGRDLELENPIYYNDKLQWLKLNWYDPLASVCADKYAVRRFVKSEIGEKYLNEIYGVFDSVEDINFDELPRSFVLKGTHGSGLNIICRDKSKINWIQEMNKMRKWLNVDYYLKTREWVYKDIKPRIVCEKFIEQKDHKELLDYRFFCFNGEPKFIAVDFSITNKKKTRRNLYDLDWNLLDVEIAYPKEHNIIVKKPEKLVEMINLSRILSSRFPHARIDFYYIKEKIIFGEITFFHQSGLGNIRPLEFEEQMGRWLILPNSKF